MSSVRIQNPERPKYRRSPKLSTKKVTTSSAVLHQAQKSLSKTVKLVKGLLIQKIVRRINSLKAENGPEVTEQLDSESKTLMNLKNVNHQTLSDTILKTQLLLNKMPDSIDTELELQHRLILKNPRITSCINDWKSALKDAIHAEMRELENGSASLSMKANRRLVQRVCTKSLFVDSLDDTSDLESRKALIENKKSTRKEFPIHSQRHDRAGKPRQASVISKVSDDSHEMYLPPEQRKFGPDGNLQFNHASKMIRQPLRRRPEIQPQKRQQSKRSDDHAHHTKAPVQSAKPLTCSSQKENPSSLHPSWEAKTLTKNTGMIKLGEFKGTKVIFTNEDD